MDLGITDFWRDTFYSSLKMSRATLEFLGFSRRESSEIVETFRQHDEQRLKDHHHMHKDEERLIYLTKQAAKELEDMFDQDKSTEKSG